MNCRRLPATLIIASFYYFSRTKDVTSFHQLFFASHHQLLQSLTDRYIILSLQSESIQFVLPSSFCWEKSMATHLERVLNSSFPDKATFMRAALNGFHPSTPTNVTTKATPMAKPQGRRGITKTKKKNVAVKSGKAKATRSVNSFMMFRCK